MERSAFAGEYRCLAQLRAAICDARTCIAQSVEVMRETQDLLGLASKMEGALLRGGGSLMLDQRGARQNKGDPKSYLRSNSAQE